MSTSGSEAELPPDEAVRFERLLADLSSRFVNLPPSEVDHQIEEGLRQIVEALDVDRSGLAEFSGDGKEFIVTHSWAREGYPRLTGVLLSAEAPWYTGMLLKGETLAFSRLAKDSWGGTSAKRSSLRASGFDPTCRSR